jgi:hypothetical protein
MAYLIALIKMLYSAILRFWKSVTSKVAYAIGLIIARPVPGVFKFAANRIDQTEVRPKDWFEYILTIPVGVFFGYFFSYFMKWLPSIDVDAAKWVLSTQVQASAAILGLLIAAAVFRLSRSSNKDSDFRDLISNYLKILSKKIKVDYSEGRTIDFIYSDFYNLVSALKRTDKLQKNQIIALGSFWAIQEISSYLDSDDFPPRFLRKVKIKSLYKIDKLAAGSAVLMWEKYVNNPSDFILQWLGAMKTICESNLEENIKYSEKYRVLELLKSDMSKSQVKFEAYQLKRSRAFLSTFYLTCIIIIFAVLIGIYGLAGIDNCKTFEDFLKPLNWLVGLPVGLSTIGLWFTLVSVVRMVK